MKRLWLAILPLVLTACGGGGETGGGGASQEQLRFWHAMGGPLGEALDRLSDEYAAEGHAIESVSMGKYQALSQKIMAAVAAGGPPDIAQCYEAWAGSLIENESLAAIDGFLGGANGLSEAELADFYPIFLEAATHGDRIWTFPFNKSVRCLYYNKDAFRAAGLDPDTPPRTWDEYREFARRLTIDENGDGRPEQFGFASQITASMFENLLVQNGGTLLNEDETAVAFDSPEGIEALEFMADLLVRDGTSLVTTGFEYQNEFLAGTAAMVEGSSVSLAFMEDKLSFELGIAALPAGKNDAQLVAGTDVVIFTTTPEREKEAWDFVKWFTEPAQTARWSAWTGYLPVRQSAMQDPVLRARLEQFPGLEAAYDQLERCLTQPKAKGWFAGRNILEREAIEPVLRGRMEPTAALVAAAKAANEELAKE